MDKTIVRLGNIALQKIIAITFTNQKYQNVGSM